MSKETVGSNLDNVKQSSRNIKNYYKEKGLGNLTQGHNLDDKH